MNTYGKFDHLSYNNVGVKMKNNISLDKIDLNEKYLIDEVLLDEHTKKRIYDLGLIENTIIKAVYKSPFGDPIAYSVRGTIIAIRNNDAKNIIVRRI